jgi:iron(III) transport system substrate-binding protein
VKPEEVPNSYEDLLNPRWVGKIGIEGSDDDWFASIVKHMGEKKGLDFFRKLAQMKPQVRTGHTLLAELVAAGEIPLVATIYNHNAERLARTARRSGKAPTRPSAGPTPWRWRSAPGGRTRRCCSSISCSARGAGADPQAQPRARQHRRADQPLNKFPFLMIDPVVVLDESEKWEKLYSELFLKGQAIQREKD